MVIRQSDVMTNLLDIVKWLQQLAPRELTVRGLDAFNGTPILDIKPFDSWDTTEDFKVPDWWIKLEKENKKE